MRAIQEPAFPHLVWLRPAMTEALRPPTLADIAFFRGADLRMVEHAGYPARIIPRNVRHALSLSL